MPKPAPKTSKAAAKTGKSTAAKASPKAKMPTRPAKSDSKKVDAKHPEVKAEKKVPKVAEPKKADAKKTDAKTAKGTEAKKSAKAPLVEVKKTSAKSEKVKVGDKHEAKGHEAKSHDAKHDSKHETKHEAKGHDSKHDAKHEAKGHDAKHDSKHDAKHDAKRDVKHDAKAHDANHDKAAKAAVAKAEEDAKAGRKGITIVTPKPVKKMPPKPTPIGPVPMSLGRLMDPTNPPRRPLIPSGPKAAATRPLGAQGADGTTLQPVKGKTPFAKRELDRYREMLLTKRAQLVGDVRTMESQALQGDSGSLSSTPQHMAEQGSETYDQSLSLDLAEKDRKLIREIDDALTRIEQGTYGICEISGKPIKHERLEELPWARCTIEAQRELERLRMRV